jgi:thioredoxin 1
MKEIDGKNFEDFIGKHRVVLVDFFANWCGPCRALSPTITAIAEEFADRAGIAKCDIDVAGAVAEKYNVRAVPTLVFFKDGKVVETITGTRTREDLTQRLQNLLS